MTTIIGKCLKGRFAQCCLSPILLRAAIVVVWGLAATDGFADYQSPIILSVKDFGATGDGTTDDSSAIQDALEYAFTNGKDLYFPSATYAIGTTLVIPQYMDYTMRGIKIDCGNSTFKMLSNITLFTSGYASGGGVVTNFGTSDDSHYSTGIVLENFKITTASGTLTAPALKIQDWHQGSIIRNISSGVNHVILLSHNNYYVTFDNIRTICTSSSSRFVFSGQHNLNKFSGLLAANAAVGYQFTGPVTACQFTNNSVEGVGIGLQFDSTVYDFVIENNYMEGFSDVAVKFNDYVLGATLRNNYVNFLGSATSYFVDYEPSPLNNITIEADNAFLDMPGPSNMIKILDNNYSTGVVVRRPKENATGLADLLVSNTTHSSNIDWQQKVDMPGMRANVVNKYAVGNYSGQYTTGHNSAHGFEWVNTSSSTLRLKTKITPSSTQRIYVNIYVYGAGGGNIAGEFVGSRFYQYGTSGVSVTDVLSVSTVSGCIQINGVLGGTVTECFGEIRLM